MQRLGLVPKGLYFSGRDSEDPAGSCRVLMTVCSSSRHGRKWGARAGVALET